MRREEGRGEGGGGGGGGGVGGNGKYCDCQMYGSKSSIPSLNAIMQKAFGFHVLTSTVDTGVNLRLWSDHTIFTD